MKWIGLKRWLISIYLVFSLITVGFITFPDSHGQPDPGGTRTAQTYIVDINGGGDFTSIQEAIDYTGEGDTIYVWAGTYSENLKIEKRISLIGNGSSETIIVGMDNERMISISGHYVDISGFNITNNYSPLKYWSRYEKYGIYLSYVNNVKIFNNTFWNNSIGIFIQNSDYILITNNNCSCNEIGIIIDQSNSIDMLNNVCQFNEESGITN